MRHISLIALGMLLVLAGCSENALPNCPESVAGRGPDVMMAVSCYNRGVEFSSNQQYRRAISEYSKAIHLDPKFYQAFNLRGEAYAKLKQYDRALQDYNTSVRINPRYSSGYEKRGLAYYDLKQYRRAIENFTQAIRVLPDNGGAFRNRGLAYEKPGNKDLAIRDFRTALRHRLRDKAALAGLKRLGANP